MTPVINEEDLLHYGILRKSGRYPWGSGNTSLSRSKKFLDIVGDLEKQGLSQVEICRAFGITEADGSVTPQFSTTQLRAAKSIAKSEVKQANIVTAQQYHEKGMSNVAIGQKMGINESSVRALLAPGAKDKSDALGATAAMLKDQVAQKKFVDIGKGNEHHLDISSGMLNNAVAVLKEEGYEVYSIPVKQLGTGQNTNVKVLAPPGTTWGDVKRGQSDIQLITVKTDDHGRSYTDLGILPPMSISSKRVGIKYAEDGGTAADGVMYVRRGVPDVSIGAASYAQVRVMVDKTHYIKGMAMYKDDLPPGIDVQFNTNKSDKGNKLDALKELKRNDDGTIDQDNPFGANISRQLQTQDSKGNKKVTSVMNLVNEEGDWSKWSRTLSTQMLSKQSPTLAKAQLDLTYKQREEEFKKINELTNPAVRKKLLESFGDDASSAAVHLKAAAIPRTHGHHVILPVSSMKPTEIYAPNYRQGESVVLIRHPHGGTFEIPELTVNNNQREAKKLLGEAKDAVGIHHSVAERLSGADFDGDTVLVIPNSGSRKVKTTPALEGLKGFDPMIYKIPEGSGIKPITPKAKQVQMGQVSNLINDMTIRGASTPELARAVRHSMVVIDAEKHSLNVKLSAEKNGISSLKEKYQGGPRAGANTLISLAGKEARVEKRKERSASKGGPIDKATGERVYEKNAISYVDPKTGKTKVPTSKVELLAITPDAHTLSSGTKIERIYADHSNKLKALGNQARKESVNTPPIVRSPSAAKAYAPQVTTLTAKLKIAERNAPLERKAQIIANATVKAKMEAQPDMDDASLKKVRHQAMNAARLRMGAGKEKIDIDDDEWAAIQAGAISNSKLVDILGHADMERVRKLATPRTQKLMSPNKIARAKLLFANGATRAEVADALGVSLSTLDEATTISE